jgi:hypothetical protein
MGSMPHRTSVIYAPFAAYLSVLRTNKVTAMIATGGWETCWYLLMGGALTAAGFGILLVLASPAVFMIGLERGAVLARHALVFVAVLFACGAPANAIFTLTMRDRYYYAADPFVDWLPWLPSGDWVLDIACGGHYLRGASAWTLHWAWLALAIPVWALSIWCFRWLLRHEWSW